MNIIFSRHATGESYFRPALRRQWQPKWEHVQHLNYLVVDSDASVECCGAPGNDALYEYALHPTYNQEAVSPQTRHFSL